MYLGILYNQLISYLLSDCDLTFRLSFSSKIDVSHALGLFERVDQGNSNKSHGGSVFVKCNKLSQGE